MTTKLPQHVRVVYEIEKLLEEDKPDMKRIKELRKIANCGTEKNENGERVRARIPAYEQLGITEKELDDYNKLCDRNGIPRKLFYQRVLINGIDMTVASTVKTLKRRDAIYRELGLTRGEWKVYVQRADSIGLTQGGLIWRLRQGGMSIEDAVTKPVKKNMRRV